MGFELDMDNDDFDLDDLEDQQIANFMYPACNKLRRGWIPEDLTPPGRHDIDDWGDE